MKHKLINLIFFCLASFILTAQGTGRRNIRIVDTLSAQDKENRNPVILRSEVDSLVHLYNDSKVDTMQEEPLVKADNQIRDYLLATGIGALLFIAVLLYLLFFKQKKFHKSISVLTRQIQQLELAAWSSSGSVVDINPGNKIQRKISIPGLEKKIQLLTAQLEKATEENKELELSLAENRQIRHDFELVKQQMMEVYKIRNYPGFNKEKTETEIVKSMLDTEQSVALYAYEHFLKPIMAITDANKNNPARISTAEKEKLLNLLISLSLLYSEYLYLRISDLSIGGKIAERIDGLKNGNNIDTALLKQLSTEHGSRALVLRLVLSNSSIENLSYPVFDETNLNLS